MTVINLLGLDSNYLVY